MTMEGAGRQKYTLKSVSPYLWIPGWKSLQKHGTEMGPYFKGAFRFWTALWFCSKPLHLALLHPLHHHQGPSSSSWSRAKVHFSSISEQHSRKYSCMTLLDLKSGGGCPEHLASPFGRNKSWHVATLLRSFQRNFLLLTKLQSHRL